MTNSATGDEFVIRYSGDTATYEKTSRGMKSWSHRVFNSYGDHVFTRNVWLNEYGGTSTVGYILYTYDQLHQRSKSTGINAQYESNKLVRTVAIDTTIYTLEDGNLVRTIRNRRDTQVYSYRQATNGVFPFNAPYSLATPYALNSIQFPVLSRSLVSSIHFASGSEYYSYKLDSSGRGCRAGKDFAGGIVQRHPKRQVLRRLALQITG